MQKCYSSLPQAAGFKVKKLPLFIVLAKEVKRYLTGIPDSRHGKGIGSPKASISLAS